MKDLMEKYTVEYLAKFDVVMAHAFDMFKSKQKGAVLPDFKEVRYYNEAKEYALALHRLGMLEDMYARITGGTV